MCDNTDNTYKIDLVEKFIDILDMKQDVVQLEEMTSVKNPLDINEDCCLLNSKKKSFYKYTYEPRKLIDNINKIYELYKINISEEFYLSYKETINKMISSTDKENCCNCVSFTLYVIDKTCKDFLCKRNQRDFFEVIDKLYGYLSSIEISVTNIEKNLKNFISRFYLDFSVIEFVVTISEISNESLSLNTKFFTYIKDRIINIMKFLYNNPSVEIYTYICDSYKSEIEKTRSLRFLPLLDENVNIKIIREADGIVSCLDCYNIEQFEKSNRLMMTYNILELPNFLNLESTKSIQNYLTDKTKKDIQIDLTPYSRWLRLYFPDEDNIRLFDILAGDIGFSFQINKEYYDFAFNNFKKRYDKLRKRFSFEKAIKVGYDEMFLNELFSKIISIKTDDEIIKSLDEINIYDCLLILDNVFYPKTHLKIDTYDILGKSNLIKSIDFEKLNPDYELEFMEYVLDSNLKNLIQNSHINPNEGVFSLNKILTLLNVMPKKSRIETFVLELYKNNIIHYDEKEQLNKKYKKYKQKYIQSKFISL